MRGAVVAGVTDSNPATVGRRRAVDFRSDHRLLGGCIWAENDRSFHLAGIARLRTRRASIARRKTVAEVVASIEAVGPTLTSIGGAVIGLAVIALTFKWAKGMVLS